MTRPNTYMPDPAMINVTIDLYGEGQVQWEEVADQGGHAEGGRLPVEGQWHSQALVGIPQRQLPMVHLRPCQH